MERANDLFEVMNVLKDKHRKLKNTIAHTKRFNGVSWATFHESDRIDTNFDVSLKNSTVGVMARMALAEVEESIKKQNKK